MPSMITSIFTHFLLLFLVHLFSNEFISLQASGFGSYSTNFTTTCWEMERNALLKFKEGLKDPSGRLSSWVGNYCCKWSGVGCNRQTGHVKKLNLTGASLQGTISPSLLDLKYLNYLDLSWNNFEQTPIPNFIGSFTNLEYLDLSVASFRGLVPPHLGNLSNLRYLDLSAQSFNHSTQSFEQDALVSDLNWILGLSSLELLNLGMANLSFASTNWLQAINMLPSLMVLGLSSCRLHDIPTSLPIVNFSSIEVIDLSLNDFNSSLPGWLFNISSLAELDLSFNGFSGRIPPYLENLNNMRDLNLGFNDLSGPLPISIGNLSSLEILRLCYNQLNGTIPGTIGQLKILVVLDLSSNNWGGVVSRIHFLHLNNMKAFLLSSIKEKSLIFDVEYDWIPPFSLNAILISNCQMNPKFPIWLQTQKELQAVHLTEVGISGYVPDWFWKLSPQIEVLSLYTNKLCGQLPRSLKFQSDSAIDLSFNLFEGPIPLFSSVSQLKLKHNSLSGPIPANFAHAMPHLEYLDLSENNFNGSIPSSINKLEKLQLLFLDNNELSGKIPSMNRLNELETLDLSNNNLSGNIPSSLCSSPLVYLKLNGNKLYGKLSSLQSCTKLVILGLANNQFRGVIPRWIGETLSRLWILKLQGNMFRGNIPKNLCNLPSLHAMDLGQNNLSGSIPPCLGNLSGLYDPQYDTNEPFALLGNIAIFHVFANGVSVEVYMPFFEELSDMEFNVKGQTLEFVKIVVLVNLIDLSSNNLEGEIPKEIVKLSALGTLNLSRNQLTGNIPEKIGDLQLLETLDLSINHLSGPIPTSASSMTLLSHLNLSYNDLSGPIPATNQFQTFNDPSIYEGNPKLCGAPLPTNCSTHKNDTPEGYTGKDKDESWSERLWFYIGTTSGFLVGFWAVCGTLVIKRSWRNAYFCFVEEMKDRIYVFIVVKVASLQKKLKGSERN